MVVREAREAANKPVTSDATALGTATPNVVMQEVELVGLDSNLPHSLCKMEYKYISSQKILVVSLINRFLGERCEFFDFPLATLHTFKQFL